MRREHAEAGVALDTPASWTEVTDSVPDLLAAWAEPAVAGSFRTNVTVTADEVGGHGEWRRLRHTTWLALSGMLLHARLLDERLDEDADRLDRWVHHQVGTDAIVMHQVALRRAGRLITATLSVPTLALPDADPEVLAVPGTLDVTR